MTQTMDTIAESYRDYVKKILHYQEALELMYWDLRTGAPRKSVELRSDAIGTLSAEAFRMSVSEEMETYLHALSEPSAMEKLDPITQASVREMKLQFDRNKQIPQARYQAYVVLTSQAESVWEEARATNDFARFQPYLEQIVAMNIEFVEYWGYQDNKYDTLLDMYEPGITVAMLDKIFGDLREDTVDLVKAITASRHQPDIAPFQGLFEIGAQKQLSRLLLERIGYDFCAGRLDETVHPFMTALNHYDARVTTKYLADDIRSAVFSTIHEGGHALYEQGISPDLIGTPLCTGTSMGIHESQSRFWENMLGRSREFWKSNYGDVQRLFPEFAHVPLETWYRGVNEVKPSLIRIEADEVTYNLHIMIRYELEKALINQTIQVSDLPEMWRVKMDEYLGVVPETDADGVLQDVHWSGGSFGYFPSYSLGNIYAAQFRHQLHKEMPDYAERVTNGDFLAIKTWFNEKVHRYGKMLKPAEIVRQVTGEEINAKYLVTYFKEKFAPLYQI